MRAIRRRLPGEEGSALLISLMMIFIMTVLGLALFDLGVIENRLTSADEADARALEIANAALERGYKLETDYMITAPHVDTLADLSLFDTSQNIYFASISNAPFLGGGTYTLEFMNVTPTTANGAPFGQPCVSSGGLCKDLLLMRARGSLLATGASPSATYGRVRAVQVLLHAESLSPFAYAVTAETQGPNQIRGLIAGSVNLLACSTCNPFGFDSSSLGQRNHYNDDVVSGGGVPDAATLMRIPVLPNVCPAGLTCTTRMFSMGATLKIAAPTTSPAVATAASLGESTNPGPYTHDGNTFVGKGTLENVFVADGCSTATCSDNFTLTGGAAVNVNDGNLKKPYPRRPARSFPLLNTNADGVTVGITTFAHYACLSGSAFPCAGGGSDFVTTHAGGGSTVSPAALAAGTVATTFSGTPACDGACPDLGAALSGGDFENTTGFVHDFVFTNQGGPSSGTPANRQGRICWTGPSGGTPRILRFATSPATGGGRISDQAVLTTQAAVQSGANCTPVGNVVIATTPAPVLLFVNGNFNIGNSGGGVNTSQYEGAAIIVVNGTVSIEGILQTLCPAGAPCTNQKFPDNHMLAILSSGDMSIGLVKSGLNRVMALLYTEGNLRSGGGPGLGSRNIIIGTVAARTFCFAKGCAGSGSSDETRLFQAGLTVFPEELLPGRNRWAIVPLQKFWRECAPVTVTPNYTFTTGMCPY